MIEGRSFFIMSQGYMGLAPSDVQNRDYVVLLEDAKFPSILRKKRNGKNKYRLLGESFMDAVTSTELIEQKCRDLSVEKTAIV